MRNKYDNEHTGIDSQQWPHSASYIMNYKNWSTKLQQNINKIILSQIATGHIKTGQNPFIVIYSTSC